MFFFFFKGTVVIEVSITISIVMFPVVSTTNAYHCIILPPSRYFSLSLYLIMLSSSYFYRGDAVDVASRGELQTQGVRNVISTDSLIPSRILSVSNICSVSLFKTLPDFSGLVRMKPPGFLRNITCPHQSNRYPLVWRTDLTDSQL